MITQTLIKSYEHLKLSREDSDDSFQLYQAATGEEIDYYPLANKLEIYHNSEPIAYIACIETDEEFISLMKMLQFTRTKE